jgi:hypothetical protein
VAQLHKAAAIKERIEQLERDITAILGISKPTTIGGMVRRRRKDVGLLHGPRFPLLPKRVGRKVNAGKITAATPAKVRVSVPCPPPQGLGFLLLLRRDGQRSEQTSNASFERYKFDIAGGFARRGVFL